MMFRAPWMLGLILLLPLFRKLFSRARDLRARTAELLRGKREPAPASPKPLARIRLTRDGLILGAFAALILALSQPIWNPRPGPMSVRGRDLVVILDISRSMLAADVFPSRLDAARIALHESLDALRGQRIGLITFAGSASVRVPLTLDHNFVRYMLDQASPANAQVGSTSLQAAVEKALDIVLPESESGLQDLMIITDGEDHISDIDATAQALEESGTRALILGIGDPVAGANVPDVTTTNTWMQYKGEDVVSRLDESTLLQLAASPNVTYHAARTRPFDLVALYHEMMIETADLPIGDQTQLIFSEGYPYLIALALLLWILSDCRRAFPMLAAILIVGCTPRECPLEECYATPYEQGLALWKDAQPLIETDPGSAQGALLSARQEFLQAALARPGDLPAAEQIAGVTRQLHAVDKAVKAQEEAEADLTERLQAAIEALRELTPRESALARRSQQILRKRPPTPPTERAAAVPLARTEQQAVHDGTKQVLNVVAEVQATIQKMLAAAFNEGETKPPTEMDEAAACLTTAQAAQRNAMEHLAPDAAQWPHANSAFHTAARHMQDALDLLSDQNQQQDSDADSQDYDENEMDWDFEEDMEWSDSDASSNLSMPMSSQGFKTALENNSLPTPNYTAEEILMEEAANQEQRAQKNAGRAGANVEKNW
ncbi:MAG: VWA domain-containing protein [Verrucomicrobia bacterium]|jgi:Ca-activated chloride channel homolog|nr:VWA domain-containing protein [Verrucomicrobiota bacterium]